MNSVPIRSSVLRCSVKILILLFITVPLVTDLSAVAEPNIKRISEASQNAPNLQKKSEKGDDPLVPSESESPRPLLSPRESLFFKAITLNFRSPNMDFEFEPEDSNLDSLQYDSNSSYLFGVSTETQLGYFSFALPVYKAGEPEESDKSTSRVITDAFDLRYELALGGHTVWRAKYLKYKGFYKKEASTTEILRDDINASTIELTGFYYLTPESFPTNRQSDLTNGFAQKGSSMFVFASLFQNSIKGKDPLVDSKYDIFLGKNKGFTEVNAQGLSVGGGYGYNHLAKNNKLSLVGILGAGGNYQTRTVKSALHQETKETFGLSVVVELSITYLLQNSWYTGLGANYITQASNVDDLSLVIGNMDILVYVGKRF